MITQEIINKLTDYINNADESITGHEEIYVNPSLQEEKHEFLFFLKPEITMRDENVKLSAILEMLFGKLELFRLNIKDIRILSAAYLEKFNIIARHYGVINTMSRKPMENLSQEALEKFRQAYGVPADQSNLLGSLEFLHRYSEYDPGSLDDLWQRSETVKLAGGTYCARITARSEPVYLINGFHPRQLIHFTEEGRSIAALTLTGTVDWSVARNEFIGKTNPADAVAGSLRNDLLVNRQAYGLETVSSSRNGFHLSAGPVEGLVELMRYCSDYASGKIKNMSDFVFGRKLIDHFGLLTAQRICDNEIIHYEGKRISVFDLTEEKNNEEAVKLLKEATLI